MGYNINRNARLKIFSIILAREISIEAFAKVDSFVVIAGLDKLVMKEYSAIQRYTYISGNSLFMINKRSMVGSRCVINAGAGDVEIGEYSAFAPRSSIYTHGTFLPATLGYPTTNNGVKIGDFCWIMQGSSIGPGVIIESNSIVLPGSSIVKNIPANMVVYDTPVERKKFPIYFFKKKLDDTDLVLLIKEITISYLNMLKARNSSLDFTVDYNFINVTYQKNKKYQILFSEINSSSISASSEITQIHFYYDFDLDIMISKKYVCYDFKRIIKSYPKLPEILDKFDDYAFGYYGLKFIDTDYF
jgi:acetyltransferase-like isoleucine patch superfamily enzyme